MTVLEFDLNKLKDRCPSDIGQFPDPSNPRTMYAKNCYIHLLDDEYALIYCFITSGVKICRYKLVAGYVVLDENTVFSDRGVYYDVQKTDEKTFCRYYRSFWGEKQVVMPILTKNEVDWPTYYVDFGRGVSLSRSFEPITRDSVLRSPLGWVLRVDTSML